MNEEAEKLHAELTAARRRIKKLEAEREMFVEGSYYTEDEMAAMTEVLHAALAERQLFLKAQAHLMTVIRRQLTKGGGSPVVKLSLNTEYARGMLETWERVK